MRKREILRRILILTGLLICLTGCGRQGTVGTAETGQSEEAESEETAGEDGLQEEIREPEAASEESSIRKEVTEQSERYWLLDFSEEDNKQEETGTVEEILFDFSFKPDTIHKEVADFSLALSKLKEPVGEYELRLYDGNGGILQRVPCGALTELIEISSGGFDHSPEFPTDVIEIFSSGAPWGLYIGWNREKSRFYDAIEIPRHTEVRDREKMLVEEDGNIYRKSVYALDRWDGLGSYEVRRLSLDKETGELEIRDCLDDVSLLKETVQVDDEGNLVNKEYYDMLLWEDIYLVDYPVEYDEDRWTMICGEWIDGEWTIEYESKEEMLESMGFADSEPVYQYYDWHHNLLLELYMDETMEHGCGIDYEYSYNSNMEKVADACGFVIHGLKAEKEWEDRNVYAEISSIAPDDEEGFEETIEYTPDGRPNYYLAQGMVAFNSLEGPVPTRLLELEYVYRDDGSLFYRYYWPYGASWSSQGSVYSFYDEKERVIYEYEYASCETIRYYYIYQDESDKPAYHLEVNYICDDAWLYLIK